MSAHFLHSFVPIRPLLTHFSKSLLHFPHSLLYILVPQILDWRARRPAPGIKTRCNHSMEGRSCRFNRVPLLALMLISFRPAGILPRTFDWPQVTSIAF